MANSKIINSEWESSELEHVNKCPYCASNYRIIAYQNVQDWSFYSAPGKWTYWDCLDCKTLYLDPRPKEQYIHQAYANYYTHENAGSNFTSNFKLRLKNEIIAKKYKIKLYPNLFLPMFLKHILKFFNGIIYEPYGISLLLSSPKGKFMDVGCGGGQELICIFREIIVINEVSPSVVRRIDINQLHLAEIRLLQQLQRIQVVALDEQVLRRIEVHALFTAWPQRLGNGRVRRH